jgi:hypothetical protein
VAHQSTRNIVQTFGFIAPRDKSPISVHSIPQIAVETPQFQAFPRIEYGTFNWNPATMCLQGCLIADLNEDCLMDVLVVYCDRSPIVYLRKTPADSKTPPSVAEFEKQELIEGGDRWYSTTAAAADLDGDGHLDLIIGNYIPDGSRMLDENAQESVTLHDSLARSGNGGGL